jgi:hypothetical protein
MSNKSAARIAVLLGAGASVEAGLPTTKDMTDQVIARLDETHLRRLLEFVRYTLAADAAARQVPDEPSPDIERLFAAVDLLIDRGQQPWSPFVSAWNAP